MKIVKIKMKSAKSSLQNFYVCSFLHFFDSLTKKFQQTIKPILKSIDTTTSVINSFYSPKQMTNFKNSFVFKALSCDLINCHKLLKKMEN